MLGVCCCRWGVLLPVQFAMPLAAFFVVESEQCHASFLQCMCAGPVCVMLCHAVLCCGES